MSEEWVDLRVLVVNTHVGMLLPTAVRKFVRDFRPHLVLLQEVQSPLARARLRLVFLFTLWSLTGTRPPSTRRGGSGTIIAARRSRFRRLRWSNNLVTRYRDRFHPERRLTYADLLDKRTGHKLRACSIHTWAGAGLPEHAVQVRTYELAADDAHRQLMLAVFGGDANERMNDVETQIEAALRRQNMVAVRVDGLDGLWTSGATDVRWLESTSQSMTQYRGGEKHHRAILATVQLRKLSSVKPRP